ncbi:unnamed protein product [Musa acuminata var. zebrina]
MRAAMVVCTSVLFLVVTWLARPRDEACSVTRSPLATCVDIHVLAHLPARAILVRGFTGCHYIRVSSHKLLKGQSREGEKPRSSIPVVQCDNRPRSIASNVSHMLHIRWESNLHLHLFIFLPLQCKQLSHALDQSLQRCRYVVPRKRRKPQRSLHLQPR